MSAALWFALGAWIGLTAGVLIGAWFASRGRAIERMEGESGR